MKLARSLGVEFAFPTQTIRLERSAAGTREEERAPITAAGDDPRSAGLEVAARVFEDSYGVLPAQRGPVVIERVPLSKHRRKGDVDDDATDLNHS